MPWGAPPGAWCLLEAPHLASCGRLATSSLQPCLFGQKFAHGGAEIFQPRGRLQHRSQLRVCGEQPGPYPRPELLRGSWGAWGHPSTSDAFGKAETLQNGPGKGLLENCLLLLGWEEEISSPWGGHVKQESSWDATWDHAGPMDGSSSTQRCGPDADTATQGMWHHAQKGFSHPTPSLQLLSQTPASGDIQHPVTHSPSTKVCKSGSEQKKTKQ